MKTPSLIGWIIANAVLCASLLGFAILILSNPRKVVSLKKGVLFVNHGIQVNKNTNVTGDINTIGGLHVIGGGTLSIGGMISQTTGKTTIDSIQFVEGLKITDRIIKSWNTINRNLTVRNKNDQTLNVPLFTINNTTPARSIPFTLFTADQLEVDDPSGAGWFDYDTTFSDQNLLCVFSIPATTFSQYFMYVYLGCRLNEGASTTEYVNCQWTTQIRLYPTTVTNPSDYIVLQTFSSTLDFTNNQCNQSFAFGFTVPIISNNKFLAYPRIVPVSIFNKFGNSGSDGNSTLLVNSFSIFLKKVVSSS